MRAFWLRYGDVLALLVGALLLAAFIAVNLLPRSHGNWGFGPEWTCTNPAPGYSDPVCIKKTE